MSTVSIPRSSRINLASYSFIWRVLISYFKRVSCYVALHREEELLTSLCYWPVQDRIMASKEDVYRARTILTSHVKKTYQNAVCDEPWRNLPEVPTSDEIMPHSFSNPNSTSEPWNEYQQDPVYDDALPHNIIDGPWPSKEDYIGAHYQICRKDAIAPLQRSV